MQTVNHLTLNVRGMHCGSCVARIRRALSELAGVESVNVDLAGGSARIAGSGFAAADLVDALAEAGYHASVADDARLVAGDAEHSRPVGES